MVLISVVLNTYNSDRFIRKTIASVLKQTFCDFELIVIDDGSQDQTIDIISEIQDNRIQVYSYPNGGIAKSRNRGLARASGEFVAFLDHDDLWNERKLEQQLLELKDKPLVSFVYSWVDFIDENDQLLRSHIPIQYSGKIFKKLLTQNFIMTLSNPLIRRSCLLEIGGFDEEIYGIDDRDVLLRLSKNNEVTFSPHCHVYYRVVQGSASANVLKMEQGYSRFIAKYFPDASPELLQSKKHTVSIIYQYLCFRVLEEMSSRESSLIAIRYLFRSYRNRPSLWTIAPLSKAIFKIMILLVLPLPLAKKLVSVAVKRFKQFTPTL